MLSAEGSQVEGGGRRHEDECLLSLYGHAEKYNLWQRVSGNCEKRSKALEISHLETVTGKMGQDSE